jgi:hypothetical protein
MDQKEKIRSQIEEKEDEGAQAEISGGGALSLTWDLRMSSQKNTKENTNSNPNPNLQKGKGAREGVLPGHYLVAADTTDRHFDAVRESHPNCGGRGFTPLRVPNPPTHGFGPKGTTANPLGSDALSLVGNALTGERACGSATTLLRPPWAAHHLDLAR